MLTIEIEPLFFQEYYVAVYKDLDLILDKKYYCINLEVALLTAQELSKQYPEAIIKTHENK